MTPRLIAVVALVCCASSAHATSLGDWSFTAVEENDGFNYSRDHTDRYYTQGTLVAGTSPAISCGSTAWIAQVFAPFEKPGSTCTTDARAIQPGRDAPTGQAPVLYRWGVDGGQNIYTPASRSAAVDPKDRPYAGWAYGGLSLGRYTPTVSDTLELQVGMVGPSSGAAWVQDHVHQMMRATEFLGWDQQLKDEAAFLVVGERQWAPHRLWAAGPQDNPMFAVESTDHLDVALGTVQDSVSVGRTYRAGFGLDADAGPPRIRPAPSGSSFILTEGWSGYVFAGLDGRAVAHDIFLDGNTFRSSPHVDKNWLVGEATAGAALRWRALRLAYSYVVRSEEFHGQRGPQKFGSWSLTLVPFHF